MLSINTNITSLFAMDALNKNTNAMNVAMNRLSTGYRINSSKDDAAGCAISASLSKEISSFDVAQDNAQMGQSMIDIASSTLDNIQHMVQRIRTLAVESANGTYGDEERVAMQKEVEALVDEIYRVKDTTEFNGKKIFGAETKPVSITEKDAVDEGYIVVKTASDFKAAIELNNPDCKIMLFADIDLNDLDTDANGSNWKAVGTSSSNAFKGVIDGNGFSISNLTIHEPNTAYQGLFGYTNGAKLENIVLKNVDVTGKNYSGGLVGYAKDTEFEKCVVSGEVNSAGNWVGGLAGYSDGSTISNSSSDAEVTGKKYTAGLVGYACGGSEISDCDATGTVTGNGAMFVGGLVGMLTDSSTVDNCSSSADVTGHNDYIGGLIGSVSEASVSNSTSTATVNTDSGNGIGGFVGLVSDSSTIDNCFSGATVSGAGTGVGGFVGEVTNASTIEDCSSFSTVTGTGSATGGFVGYLHGASSVISNCNSNSTVTGESETGGFVGNLYDSAVIENCASTGDVNGSNRIGGFVGISYESSAINDSATAATVVGSSNTGAFGGEIRNDSTAEGNEYNSTVNAGMDPVGLGVITPAEGQIKDNESLVINPDKKGGNTPSNDTKEPGEDSTKIRLQVGINNDIKSTIDVDTGFKIGDFRVSVETEEDATGALDKIDTLMNKIIKKQTELGATSNRLQSTMEYQQVQKNTKIAVLSVIKDADIAKESSDYIKSQILQQTTASLLSQANQTPSIALRLLSI